MPHHQLTHVFFLTVDGVDPSSAGLTADVLGVTPRVVDQFDLRRSSPEDLTSLADYSAFRVRYDSHPTAGEIGCALAHRYCWSTLFDQGGDVALVFEDDACLRGANTGLFQQLMQSLPVWDLINLRITHGVFARTPEPIVPGVEAYRATVTCFGAHAYLITRSGAAHFLNCQTPQIRNFADWPDEVWNLNMWGLRGFPVELSERPSTMGRALKPIQIMPTTKTEKLVHAWRTVQFRARLAYRRRLFKDVTF